jgi:hypothetical protein
VYLASQWSRRAYAERSQELYCDCGGRVRGCDHTAPRDQVGRAVVAIDVTHSISVGPLWLASATLIASASSPPLMTRMPRPRPSSALKTGSNPAPWSGARGLDDYPHRHRLRSRPAEQAGGRCGVVTAGLCWLTLRSYVRFQSWGNYRAPALTSIKAEGQFPRVPSYIMSLVRRHCGRSISATSAAVAFSTAAEIARVAGNYMEQMQAIDGRVTAVRGGTAWRHAP